MAEKKVPSVPELLRPRAARARPGRPPVAPEDRRNQVVSVRFSTPEYAAVFGAAALSASTPADFLRRLAVAAARAVLNLDDPAAIDAAAPDAAPERPRVRRTYGAPTSPR